MKFDNSTSHRPVILIGPLTRIFKNFVQVVSYSLRSKRFCRVFFFLGGGGGGGKNAQAHNWGQKKVQKWPQRAETPTETLATPASNGMTVCDGELSFSFCT